MANPAIVVDFVANTKDLQSGFRTASGGASGFSTKLKGIAKSGALAAGAAGVAGLTAAIKIGIGEWKDSTKVAAQTSAVLKSTGGVANVTAGHVDKLATSLMKKSGVDDEVIASGENMLLTFTNVRNEVGKGNDIFDQATTAALDMSTAMGTDAKNAAKDLGKALNDPEKGVGRLSRAGVTFTDSQKNMIKKLQESGDTLGAQKIILGEVNKEFGGSAVAAGKTLPGQINILKESFNNFAGDMVGKLIPVLQNTITWLRDHWPEISSALSTFWATVQPILQNLWDMFKAVADVVINNWPAIAPIVKGFGDELVAMGKVVADAIKIVTDILSGDWKQAWNDAKKLVVDAVNLIKTHISNQVAILETVAKALGSAVLHGIQAGVADVVGWVSDRLRDIRDAIISLATSVYNAAVSFGGKILHGITEGATGLYSAVRERIVSALDAITGLIDSAINRAEALGKAIFNGVKNGIGNLADAVKTAITGALSWVKGELRSFTLPAIKIKGHKITPEIHPFASLASGGIVTRPTMALMGEAGPEAVIPLSGGSASPAIEVRVFIGDRELAGIIRSEIVDTNTGMARTLLAGGVA